jgi:uncharacterized protein
MSTLDIVLTIFAGCLGGLMSGLLGVGGGVVFVPIIIYILGTLGNFTSEFSALVMANSFFVIFIIGMVGTLRQRKLGNFYPTELLVTSSTAMLFALLTSHFFVSRGYYSKQSFTIFFITLLLFILYRFLRQARKVRLRGEASIVRKHPRKYKHYFLPGFISGIIAALSGLGGGIVMIPYFTQIIKMEVKKATALSLSVITVSALPVVVFYLLSTSKELNFLSQISHTGFIIWEIVIPLSIGAAIFAPVGVNLSSKIKPHVTYWLLSVFVLITILKLLFDAFFK